MELGKGSSKKIRCFPKTFSPACTKSFVESLDAAWLRASAHALATSAFASRFITSWLREKPGPAGRPQKRVCSYLIAINGFVASFSLQATESTPIPDRPFQILDNYCLSCHDEVELKGEINLDTQAIQWTDPKAIHLWERVIKMVERSEMPPMKKDQPSQAERNELAGWLDEMLSKHSPIGGSAIRRLNRREYLHSLNDLFDINYQLPNGFPKDNEANGFDNQAEALTMSGPLLESYSAVATDLAEKLFPPPRRVWEVETIEIPAKDFTYAYSSGLLKENAMRLVSNTHQLAHSASWPTHFEAKATGTYQLKIDLSALNPPEGIKTVANVYAVMAADAPQRDIHELRLLGSFTVESNHGQRFQTEVLLEKGETLAFHYANGLISEDPEVLAKQTLRLIGSSKSNTFIESFLGQWLDLYALEDLVPDTTLFEKPRDFKYTDAEKKAYIQEAHMVFREILDDNRSLAACRT